MVRSSLRGLVTSDFIPNDPDPGTLDSLELIRKAQAGELRAFERLFERYYDRVKAMVRARLGPNLRKSVESGDLLNDAMIAAVRGFENFEIRDDAGFTHWFVRIVENRIREADRYQKAEKRDRFREIALEHINGYTSGGRLGFEPADSAPSPSAEAIRREEATIARECLAELPEASREVLRLRRNGEHTWEQIAQTLGLSSPYAARRLFARAKVELSAAVRERMGRSE